MSKIIYANKLQTEVLKSKERITVVTAEPGAGATTALVLKGVQACHERQINCSFFVPTQFNATRDGGVVSCIFQYIDPTVRFSHKSLIFTFHNGSKLKIVPCDSELEQTMSLSRDLMLFDSNIRDEFIDFHILRAYEAVIVDNINDIEREGSWADTRGLLQKHDNKVICFVGGINHITGKLDDNFLFEERGKYSELVKAHIPEKMRIEF